MRQGFVEDFQNLNPKPSKEKDHGDFEPKDLYHEKVKILNRFKKQIYKNNKMEMKAYTMVDVAPISMTLTPNLFHHNNVRITYARISNFRLEPRRSIPLYFLAMPHSMVIVTKAPFTTIPTHIITSMRSIPRISRGTDLVNMHTKMFREVDEIFIGQPSDPGGKGLGPLRPLGPS